MPLIQVTLPRALPEKVLEAFFREIQAPLLEGLLIFQREAQVRVPVDTGALAGSIQIAAPRVTGRTAEGAVLAGVRPRTIYAVAIDAGARPNPRAPRGPIVAWARRKGISPIGALLAVRRRGVRATHFWDRAAESAVPRIKDLLRRFVDEFARRY